MFDPWCCDCIPVPNFNTRIRYRFLIVGIDRICSLPHIISGRSLILCRGDVQEGRPALRAFLSTGCIFSDLVGMAANKVFKSCGDCRHRSDFFCFVVQDWICWGAAIVGTRTRRRGDGGLMNGWRYIRDSVSSVERCLSAFRTGESAHLYIHVFEFTSRHRRLVSPHCNFRYWHLLSHHHISCCSLCFSTNFSWFFQRQQHMDRKTLLHRKFHKG